jgi:hypothetical protein
LQFSEVLFIEIMVEPVLSLDAPANNDNASTHAQMNCTTTNDKIEETATTMTELATEAISALSSLSEEPVMIRTTPDKDGVSEEGVVETAADKVLVIRTDVLEPAESWIRAWVPLRSGHVPVPTIPLKAMRIVDLCQSYFNLRPPPSPQAQIA